MPDSMTDSPNGKHRTTAVRNPATPVVRMRIGWSVRRSQARSGPGSPPADAERCIGGRSRASSIGCGGHSARRIVTTATIGTRIASCGLIRAAMTVQIAARSGWSRHSARRPSSRKTTPKESTWPQRTESNQVTGLKTTSAAPSEGRRFADADLAGHRPDEPADREVGEDRRDLDQVADGAERCCRRARPAYRT